MRKLNPKYAEGSGAHVGDPRRLQADIASNRDSDHVKRADWQGRGSDPIAKVSAEVLDEIRAKLKPLLGL